MIALRMERVFKGPSIHGVEPVLVGRLRLTDPEIDPEADLTGACAKLQLAYPDWPLAQDLPFGVTPLQRAGHTAARWALCALNEVRGFLHCAGVVTQHEDVATAANEARVFLAYHHEGLARDVLQLALTALTAAARDPGFSRDTVLERLEKRWTLCRVHHPDYQARILMQGARALDIPVMPAWGISRYWQFGWGERSRVMFESSSTDDSHLGARVAAAKAATKAAMLALGIPTPASVLVSHASELTAAIERVGLPCVTKPLDRGGGKGVSAGLNTLDAVKAGFEYAKTQTSGPVMVEQFLLGSDHRLMVVDGRVVAVIRRDAAQVTGDGQRRVSELVAQQNAKRSPTNVVGSHYLRPIVLDAPARQHLSQQGLTVDSVLQVGQTASLRSNANLSMGGSCTDVTAQLHPEVREMAEALAQSLGLSAMGADYVTTDISQSWQAVGGAFIETNTVPGLDALVVAGWDPVEVARLALGKKPGRMALFLGVVPDADLAAARASLAAHAWPAGHGWACAGAAGLGAMTLKSAASADPWSDVRALLGHKTLKSAWLVCSAGQIQQHGLPVDRFERVVLCRSTLSEPWERLVRQQAKHTDIATDWRLVSDALAPPNDQSSVWRKHSVQWKKTTGAPQRPSEQDGALMMAAVSAELGQTPSHDVVVLGVTQEIVQLPWPESVRLLAFDHSAEMIASVWQPHPWVTSSVQQASWQCLPMGGRSVSVAVGDGSFNSLPDLRCYADVLRELARVLQPGGLLCCRYFALPLVRESLPAVAEAVKAGEVQSFHALKWRVAMAVCEGPAFSVALPEIRLAFEALFPDRDSLAADTGWPREVIDIIDVYLGVQTRYTFVGLDTLQALCAPWFTLEAASYGDYDLAERCPTLSLRLRSSFETQTEDA